MSAKQADISHKLTTSCRHLEAKEPFLQSICQQYITIVHYFKHRADEQDFTCFDCANQGTHKISTIKNSKLFACLSCIYVGCSSDSSDHNGDGGHIHNHISEHHGHDIYVDITPVPIHIKSHCKPLRYNLYCMRCEKMLPMCYPILDGADVSKVSVAEKLSTILFFLQKYWSLPPQIQSQTMSHADRMLCEPGTEEVNSMKVYTKHLKYSLRGFYNLGHTCFMSCILQACLHNPYLTELFLSNMHPHPTACHHNISKKYCMVCELGNLFNQHWTPKSRTSNTQAKEKHTHKSIAPARFLQSVWHASGELASYGQHDAHEFFISLMNQLHLQLDGTQPDCTCLIHEIFCGYLESSVTCLMCGSVSITTDPFIDLSLDMAPTTFSGDVSLLDKIEKFIQPERLDFSSGYACSRCQRPGTDCIKQLSMKQLPPVLCFHMKRFEQTESNGVKKIDARLFFPDHMNMLPFISSNIIHMEGYSDSGSPDSKQHQNIPITHEDLIYELFAVIVHQGQNIESGHYISYVLADHERHMWYKMDDSNVSSIAKEKVLSTNPYMLFYMLKSKVDYSMIPTT